MTKVEFYTPNPPHTRYSDKAIESMIDSEVPVFSGSRQVGFGKVTNVERVDGGLHITFETDANIDVAIRVMPGSVDFET